MNKVIVYLEHPNSGTSDKKGRYTTVLFQIFATDKHKISVASSALLKTVEVVQSLTTRNPDYRRIIAIDDSPPSAIKYG
jgi:hypothetical protein